MSIIQKFGTNLRRLRFGKKISQEKLAFLSNLHRTYISDIERGKRNVSLINIEKLARALKTEIRDLFNF